MDPLSREHGQIVPIRCAWTSISCIRVSLLPTPFLGSANTTIIGIGSSGDLGRASDIIQINSGLFRHFLPGDTWMKAQKLDFEKVGILLGDPSKMIRQGLKGALFNEGFRDILDTDKLPVNAGVKPVQ